MTSLVELLIRASAAIALAAISVTFAAAYAQDSQPMVPPTSSKTSSVSNEKERPPGNDVDRDVQKPKDKEGEKKSTPPSKELPFVKRVRDVKLEEGGIDLLVPVARPGVGFATVVKFPEDIKSLIVHHSDDELSIEKAGPRLVITLLKKVEGHLDAVGMSGAMYRFVLRPVTGGLFDDTVRIAGGIQHEDKAFASAPARRFPQAFRMIQAMRVGQEMPGLRRCKMNQLLDQDEQFEMRIIRAYETARLVGYVIQVANRTEDTHYFDLTQLTGNGLLMSACDSGSLQNGKTGMQLILSPKGTSNIYVIFAREP